MNLFALTSILLFLQLTLATTPPNILMIITDDQGYGDVGFNGNPNVNTPKLDRLAANSVIYDRLYASPFYSPTRAALMSGRYASRTGLETEDGGHGMLFRSFEGQLYLTLHQPNNTPEERPHFFEVKETKDNICLK